MGRYGNIALVAGAALACAGCEAKIVEDYSQVQVGPFAEYHDILLDEDENIAAVRPLLSEIDLPSTLYNWEMNGTPIYHRLQLGDTGLPDDPFWMNYFWSGSVMETVNEHGEPGHYLYYSGVDTIMASEWMFGNGMMAWVDALDLGRLPDMISKTIPFGGDIYFTTNAQLGYDGSFHLTMRRGDCYPIKENTTQTFVAQRVSSDCAVRLTDEIFLTFAGRSVPFAEYEVELLVADPVVGQAKYRINGEITEILGDGQGARLADGTYILQGPVVSINGEDFAFLYLGADQYRFVDRDAFDDDFSLGGCRHNDEDLDDVKFRVRGEMVDQFFMLHSMQYALRVDPALGSLFIGEGETLRQHLAEPGAVPGRLDMSYICRNAGGKHVVRVGKIPLVSYRPLD